MGWWKCSPHARRKNRRRPKKVIPKPICSPSSGESCYPTEEDDDPFIHPDVEKLYKPRYSESVISSSGVDELRRMISELHHRINHSSARLVRQLKRKDRHLARLQKNCDVVTAVLQAASLKRRKFIQFHISYIIYRIRLFRGTLKPMRSL